MKNFIARQIVYSTRRSCLLLLAVSVMALIFVSGLVTHTTANDINPLLARAIKQSHRHWTTIKTFSGSDSQVTPLFTMKGDWRIVWSCDTKTSLGYNTNTFKLDVGSPEGSGFTVANLNCEQGNNSGISNVSMADDIFLTITTEGAWKVEIQD